MKWPPNIKSPRVQPGKFVIGETKRLLQHYPPISEVTRDAFGPLIRTCGVKYYLGREGPRRRAAGRRRGSFSQMRSPCGGWFDMRPRGALPHSAGEARLPVWVKNLTNGDVRPASVYPSIVLQNSKNDFQRFSAKRATKR